MKKMNRESLRFGQSLMIITVSLITMLGFATLFKKLGHEPFLIRYLYKESVLEEVVEDYGEDSSHISTSWLVETSGSQAYGSC